MRWISTALLLASLLVGLAHVAGLPPFEGIDETAHYSYIEQIAKTGTLPRVGDKLLQDAQDVAESLVAAAPGFNVSLQYLYLFTADAKIIKRVRQAVKAPRDPPPTGKPGSWGNWEVQHPPFYYVLLTPAYLLSERWSLVAQLALLRGLSYLVAWLSLCLAVFVADKKFPASGPRRAMIAAPALWPFVFPGWFPEMARLGNDSLVALLVACAVAVVTCAPIRRWSTWLLLGVICGLGALTKATFFPFLAVIALLLLYRTWRRDASLWQFLGFLTTVIAVAGWWYFQRSVETGMLFATDDGMTLREKGGLIAGLMQHFSVDILAWAIPAAGMSFLWSSTFSFVTPPLITLAPLVVMLLLISCAYLFGFHSYRMYPLVQITPLILGFWSLAISYPTLEFVALYGPHLKLGIFGYGGYGGYYLHSFAPALAPVIGIAITTVARNGLARTVVWLLLGYNIAFLFGATFMQFLYFAGCGSNGFNRFNGASASACWNDWQRLTDNLDVLAYPWAALWLAAGGAIVLGVCVLTSLVLASSHKNRSKLVAAHPSGEGPLAENEPASHVAT
jgi:4-amino-4-deoxy-L-arabinose transferase-like glycosyltransferase